MPGGSAGGSGVDPATGLETRSHARPRISSVVRPREVARAVTPLELFFDLVYVFTVNQLTHTLFEHVTARGIAQMLVLTLAVMYAWFMTVWTSNWLDGDRAPVRALLLALMFASLLMSTSVAGAFDDRAGLFVIGYLAIQLGRTLFAVLAFRGHRLRRHFLGALAWELAVAPVWIAGVAASGEARLAWWAGAVALTYAGVIAGHPLPGRRSPFSSDSQIYAAHLLERFRLFFLVALGETVLSIGGAFVAQPVQAARVLALAIAFTGSVALWWCYFHRSERIGLSAVAEFAEPARLVGLGNYTLIVMVLGIVAIAVGDELAIVTPHAAATPAAAALIFGGPVLFLLAQLIFVRRARGGLARSRLLACLALLALAAVAPSVSLLVAIAAATALLVAVAFADTRAAPA